jgi:hypothetical protein
LGHLADLKRARGPSADLDTLKRTMLRGEDGAARPFLL